MASKREVSIIIKAIDRASRVLRGISNAATKDLKSVGAAAQNAARSIGLIGAALTLSLGLAVNTTASFEQGMANTQSVIGATTAELNQLTTAAREMGRVSVFTATQAADAMFNLAQAGFDTNQVIGALGATLQLATAGNTDLASTAETVVRALAAYSLQAKDAGRIANVFAAAQSKSTANVERLSSAFSFVGAVAASVNIPLEETVAIMGKIALTTAQGTRIGTSFRAAIDSLIKPTEEAKEVLERLEITVGDGAGGIRRFIDIIRDLEAAGLSAADTMTIFGRRAGPAMLTLISEGADSIEELTRNITGTNKAAEISATRLATFQGQVKLLKSATQELQIVFGNQVIPSLTDMTMRLTGLVTVTANWTKENKELAKAIGITTIALIGLTAILTTLLVGVATVAKITELLALLKRGMFLLGNTTLVLRARLALLASGITALSVAMIGVTFGAILLGLNRIATSAKRARGRVSELIDDLRLLGFSFKDISDGNKLAIESFNKLKAAEAEQIRIIAELNAKILDIEATTQRIPFGFIGRLFVGGRSEERLAKLKKDLIATEILLKQIRAAQKQFAADIPTGEVFGPPEPEIDIDKIKQLTKAQIKLLTNLAIERQRIVLSATEFEIKEIERAAAAQIKVADGNANIIMQIERVRDAQIAALRKKAADEMKTQLNEAIQAALEERDITIEGIKAEVQARLDAQKRFKDAQTARQQLLANLEIATLESQGRMFAAAKLRLEQEIEAKKLAGLTEIELEQFIVARRLEIQKEFVDKVREQQKQVLQNLVQRRIAAEADLFSKLNSIRESAFQMEQNRIRQMGRSYAGFIRSAINIGRQFFSAQEEGWIRALAATVRFITRIVAGYLRQRSLEKLKQADQAKTAAQFHIQHGAKMVALAAEATGLSLVALAAGNVAGFLQLGAAAATFAGSVLTEAALATALEGQATILQTEAAGLMTAAVAVEVAGAAVAGGLDMAADAVRRKAREDEKLARETERRLDNELRLRQQILELEGRTFEARRLGITDEASQLREMGIDENLIRRFERLSIAQAQGQGGVAIDTGGTSTPVITGGSVIAPPSTVVTQHFTFIGILESDNEVMLRELAEKLKPFTEELDELESSP